MFDIIKSQLEEGILVYPSILVLLIILIHLTYRFLKNISPKQLVNGKKEFGRLLNDAGYAYDPIQNIFYSKMNAWQRKYGYCRLYDEAAAPAGMILDSEPIQFTCNGKRWLIQLWKGQYYLNTGCEIGIYCSEEPDLSISHLFHGTFYRCVNNRNRLNMEYTLIKNGKELFSRRERHWWLTGFRPGEFSEPWELSMRICIKFKSRRMFWNFIMALKKIGYQDHELILDGYTVEFIFDKPHMPQPLTRSEETNWIVQRNNEKACELYRKITEGYSTWAEKTRAINEKEPYLFEAIFNFGKTRQLFKSFEKLKNHISK